MIAAEQYALDATKMDCFPINLTDLRGTVTDMLSQFGRNGIFENYTMHNIRHIDEMLKSLDWIIPSASKPHMTSADWFMVVVSIFLHDVGLLVTKSEFNNRYNSGFERFVDERLYAGDYGNDYRDRVHSLPPDDRDRFLYEEFVREHHGKRARAWAEGIADPALGISPEAYDAVNRVLNPLESLIRSDIGILIESHNLDDLKDRSKYPLVRPYDNTPSGTANLQYCAVLLRTADLMQITLDRAPTRLFKLISPTNPVSQTEWVKQNSVRRVKNAIKRNNDGVADETLPQDTVEIFATFNKQAGYFGLNAFLDYAEKQLQASHEIIETAFTRDNVKLRFPWRHIDREQIAADGFIKKQFKFELDQEKILNLLTGHTLYNDSLVVVRELAQNALDAVRLYDLTSRSSNNGAQFIGKINVKWDSRDRILEVIDNGTGMSLDVIERHLLKVGSSKYQDPSFQKKHPEFHAISRFGIGVLSAFMVADEVSILTLEDGAEEAKEVSLESVHGRYLVKLLRKSDPAVHVLNGHGTRFRLRLRASVSADNLLNALRYWILIPNCEFYFEEADQPPIAIGYDSPKAAVEALMRSAGYLNADTERDYKIVEREIAGFRMAYALKWSEAFREFSLVTPHDGRPEAPEGLRPTILCVHGIAVEFSTPGFQSPVVIAISDSTGANAPKTNVARTMLELNEQTRELSRNSYKILVDSIKDEVSRLVEKEDFTLTRATNEAVYLAFPLGGERNFLARYPDELMGLLSSLPVFLMEGDQSNEMRVSKDRQDMRAVQSFWTVEGEVVRSAENLLAQFKSDKTIKSTIETLSNSQVMVPSPLLCNLSSLGAFQSSIFEQFQITRIEVKDAPRQVNFLWSEKGSDPIWRDLSTLTQMGSVQDRRARSIIVQNIFARSQLRTGLPKILLAQRNVLTGDIFNFGVIRAYRRILIMPNQKIAEFFANAIDQKEDEISTLCYLCVFVKQLKTAQNRRNDASIERAIRGFLQQVRLDFHLSLTRMDEFVQAMLSSDLTYYDPFLWSSRSNAFYNTFDDEI